MSFNRKQLLKELRENAVSVPDKKERVQFVPGTIRGKKVWQTIKYGELSVIIFLTIHLEPLVFQLIRQTQRLWGFDLLLILF
jgi:hypothetical protein